MRNYRQGCYCRNICIMDTVKVDQTSKCIAAKYSRELSQWESEQSKNTSHWSEKQVHAVLAECALNQVVYSQKEEMTSKFSGKLLMYCNGSAHGCIVNFRNTQLWFLLRCSSLWNRGLSCTESLSPEGWERAERRPAGCHLGQVGLGTSEKKFPKKMAQLL